MSSDDDDSDVSRDGEEDGGGEGEGENGGKGDMGLPPVPITQQMMEKGLRVLAKVRLLHQVAYSFLAVSQTSRTRMHAFVY